MKHCFVFLSLFFALSFVPGGGASCSCPFPPSYGYTTSCSGSVSPGHVIAYYCSGQYNLAGDQSRMCQENGTWTGSAPSCVNGCPCPRIQNGYTSSCFTYQSYWRYLYYYCNSGYHRVGSSYGICRSGISWSPSPPTCVKSTPCQCPPSPANGTTSYCSGTASVNSNLYYYCNSGYYREGSNYRTCLPYGNWTEAPTCERIKPCPCPSSPTNGITNCNESHLAGAGSRVTYSCNSGYILSGSSYQTCQASGNWSGTAPICVQGCTCPTAPLNGYTRYCTDTDPVGSYVYYYCYSGYSRIGSSRSYCQSGGNWSTTKPTCQKTSCSCPPSPSNGYISYCSGSRSVGYYIYYYCNSGYSRVGYYSRRCQYGGNWTGSAPVCLRNTHCPCPSKPANGTILSNCSGYQSFGSYVYLSCDSGFHQSSGDTTRRCSPGGTWSGSDLTCEKDQLCSCPPAPTNGSRNCSANDELATYNLLHYECDSGYHIVGNEFRLCQPNGNWTGSTPVCEKDTQCQCPLPPSYGHTSACSGSVSSGYKVNYYCSNTYTLVGVQNRTCQGNGLWTGSNPSCVRGCSCPPRPVNGYTGSCSVYDSYYSYVYYYCYGGYQLYGSRSRYCTSSGTWSGSAPVCIRSTPCPCPALANGRTSYCSGTASVGTNLYYYCNSGYYREGSSSTRCLTFGNWSDTTTCRRIQPCPCPSPPSNGAINCNGSHLAGTGSRVTYSCNSGYILSGSSYRTCQNNGNWTGTAPTCGTRDQCTCPPAPSNGYISSCAGTANYGTYIYYYCNSGYTRSGSSSRRCEVGASWSGSASLCLRNRCLCPPSPSNGYITGCYNTDYVGSYMYYYCNSGYRLKSGDSSRRCLLGGNWTGSEPVCEKKMCSCPSPPRNGFISGCNVTGNTVEYSCRSGYYLVGSSTRICQTGTTWTGLVPTCERESSCSCPPAPTNGSRNCSGSNEVAAYSRLYYKCNSGYHVVGNEYRTCHPSGNWTGSTPVCEKDIECQCPFPPSYGHISTCSGFVRAGYKVSYYCNSGYSLIGIKSRTCQGNGSWTESDPICLDGCSCPTIRNGYTYCSSYRGYGNSVSYYCRYGYHRFGSSYGICQSDGSWSPSPPVCMGGTPCLCPSQPSNGYISYCFYTATVGSRINYYCNSGYYLTGDSNVTCLPSGNWSTAPVCEQVQPCPCPSSPTNGLTNCNGSHLAGPGGIVTYSCNSGYTLSGNSNRMCQTSGNWTGTNPTCVKGCTCPSSPPNGYIDDCSGTKPVDSILSYRCNAGYSIFSTNTSRTCQSDGEWSGTTPKCEKDNCPCPSSPVNGSIASCVGSALAGTYIHYYCDSGYERVGDFARMCQVGGSWTGSTPTCEKNNCPCPSSPANGYVTGCSETSSVGSYVYYYCNSGYLMASGDSPRKCAIGGNWTGREPVCEIGHCKCPPAPTNGLMNCYGAPKVGFLISYQCKEDYLLLGDSSRACQPGGNWTGNDPICFDLKKASQVSTDSDAGRDALFGLFGFVLLLIVVCLVVALVIWLVKRRSGKHASESEHVISFANRHPEDSHYDEQTLQSESNYEEVKCYDITMRNTSFMSENEENVTDCN